MDTELKELLRERAEEVRLEPDIPRPVLRRARRRRALNASVAGATAAIVVAGAVIGIQAVLDSRAKPAVVPSPSIHPPHSPTAGGGTHAFFPGFWPAADKKGLVDLQRSIDEGVAFFGTDPEEIARKFAYVEMGWRTAGVSVAKKALSPTEVRVDLWNLAVTKRAGVGPHAPAFATTVTLQQLGKKGPGGVWEVTDVRSGLIDLQCPSSRQDVLAVGSPQELCGTLAWTPAEGIVDAVLYVEDLPTKGNPSPPSAVGRAPISFPMFEGKFRSVPGGGDSAILLVRLVDPQGAVLGMTARKMVLEPSP